MPLLGQCVSKRCLKSVCSFYRLTSDDAYENGTCSNCYCLDYEHALVGFLNLDTGNMVSVAGNDGNKSDDVNADRLVGMQYMQELAAGRHIKHSNAGITTPCKPTTTSTTTTSITPAEEYGHPVDFVDLCSSEESDDDSGHFRQVGAHSKDAAVPARHSSYLWKKRALESDSDSDSSVRDRRVANEEYDDDDDEE